MENKPISSAIIKSDHLSRGYQDTSFDGGRAGIIISDFPNCMITNYSIDTILMVADEYRRCEGVLEEYKHEASCDLSLKYFGGHPRIYLMGENITQESDLEVIHFLFLPSLPS
ncbi:MAG: hypothetical protein U9Q99_01570, partial [Nanoarchaeota archaeon]|nr:hypothetical protein [Nanoarchaeota archaeon]